MYTDYEDPDSLVGVLVEVLLKLYRNEFQQKKINFPKTAQKLKYKCGFSRFKEGLSTKNSTSKEF